MTIRIERTSRVLAEDDRSLRGKLISFPNDPNGSSKMSLPSKTIHLVMKRYDTLSIVSASVE
jgi:hypothetical protein